MDIFKLKDVKAKEVVPGYHAKIVHSKNMTFVYWDIKADYVLPEHSHPHEQTSYVAEGEIIFYCEGEDDQHLCAGDMFAVPSGKKHTIKVLTERVRLVDSFTPVREDFLG